MALGVARHVLFVMVGSPSVCMSKREHLQVFARVPVRAIFYRVSCILSLVRHIQPNPSAVLFSFAIAICGTVRQVGVEQHPHALGSFLGHISQFPADVKTRFIVRIPPFWLAATVTRYRNNTLQGWRVAGLIFPLAKARNSWRKHRIEFAALAYFMRLYSLEGEEKIINDRKQVIWFDRYEAVSW